MTKRSRLRGHKSYSVPSCIIVCGYEEIVYYSILASFFAFDYQQIPALNILLKFIVLHNDAVDNPAARGAGVEGDDALRSVGAEVGVLTELRALSLILAVTV